MRPRAPSRLSSGCDAPSGLCLVLSCAVGPVTVLVMQADTFWDALFQRDRRGGRRSGDRPQAAADRPASKSSLSSRPPRASSPTGCAPRPTGATPWSSAAPPSRWPLSPSSDNAYGARPSRRCGRSEGLRRSPPHAPMPTRRPADAGRATRGAGSTAIGPTAGRAPPAVEPAGGALALWARGACQRIGRYRRKR